MNFNLFGFLNLENILFFVVFAILFLLFLFDFKITSRRSWAILVGFAGLGIFFFWRAKRRSAILERIKEREGRIKDLERLNAELEKKARESGLAYDEIRVESAKVKEAYLEALKENDEEARETIEKIREEHANISSEDLVAEIESLIGGGR